MEADMDANDEVDVDGDVEARQENVGKPSAAQLRYLRLGLNQAGGKLPLFDGDGQEISPKTIRSCVARGWAEPWFDNPAMPNWLVCKLTDAGRRAADSK